MFLSHLEVWKCVLSLCVTAVTVFSFLEIHKNSYSLVVRAARELPGIEGAGIAIHALINFHTEARGIFVYPAGCNFSSD